jgi:hypothetical protein
MNHGKLLRITDDWSVYVLENEDGSYLNTEGVIRYKNVGKDFDYRVTHESYVAVDEKGVLSVLDASGKSKFHFPLDWLDTDGMKIRGLVEDGIIKMG